MVENGKVFATVSCWSDGYFLFVAALLSTRPYHLFATLNEQKLVFHTQGRQGCEERELGARNCCFEILSNLFLILHI
mgnify:CR=1 FL=1